MFAFAILTIFSNVVSIFSIHPNPDSDSDIRDDLNSDRRSSVSVSTHIRILFG